MSDPFESAARRYRAAGRFAYGLARGKLRGDPAYAAALHALRETEGRLVDVGCGRGLLLAALREAGTALDLVGIERDAKAAATARVALGDEAAIVVADAASSSVPPCDAAAILDVLHYLDVGAQERLLDEVARALRPGGLLLVREADASAGAGFLAVRFSERLATILRGDPFRPFRYRTLAAWSETLERRGFRTSARPMGSGTPFANVWIEGRR